MTAADKRPSPRVAEAVVPDTVPSEVCELDLTSDHTKLPLGDHGNIVKSRVCADSQREHSQLPRSQQARNIAGRARVQINTTLSEISPDGDKHTRNLEGSAEASSAEDSESVGMASDDEGDTMEGADILPPQLIVRVRTTVGIIAAQLDTGARSVWVSDSWYRRHYGEPEPDGKGAVGADSKALDVTGKGAITFMLWGRRFKDVPVRVLRGLDTNMLIGLKFQQRIGLVLDLQSMRGYYVYAGRRYNGSLAELPHVSHEADVVGLTTESVRAVIEDSDVDEAIRTLDLSEFSDDKVERETLRETLWKKRAVFKGMGRIEGEEHVIAMKADAKPVVMPSRRLSPQELEVERQMVFKLVDMGVLEPCVSENAARNVFVPKKDHGIRCTGDFRGINAQTIPDRYPAEDPRAHVEWLAARRIFSCLDLKDGYYQVPLATESRHWTAVSTVEGLYQYTRMAQGLMNSGATFQRLVNSTLGNMRGKTAQGYMDDLACGTETPQQHINAVDELLGRLFRKGMRVKFSKCAFGKKQVDILGHSVSFNSIKPSDSHIDAIAELREPTNGDALARFIGLANYFAKHISDIASKLQPLQSVLNGTSWNVKKPKRRPIYIADWDQRWGKQQRAAWAALKMDLARPHVLAAPRHGAAKRIEVDASDAAVGGVLLQEEPDKNEWRPLAFMAKTLKPSELKYSVTEKECLGVVHALRTWRHYCQGEDLSVVTDHKALLWLLDNKLLRGRLARWVWTIQNIPFRIVHRPGQTLTVADILSRDVFPPPTCPHCQEALHVVHEDTELPDLADIRKPREEDAAAWEQASVPGSGWVVNTQGLLCRETTKGTRVYVPHDLRVQVLKHFHGTQLHGHYGVSRTTDRIAARFWWPALRAQVQHHINACVCCAVEKVPRPQRQGKLGKYQVSRRGEIVAVDILSITPASSNGCTKVLVIADALTRLCWAVALPDEKAATVADALYKEWICRFGPPEHLLSDRGKTFTGEVITRLCKRLGVKKISTSPYHPQCDGMIERLNRTLLKDIRAYVSPENDNWHSILPGACFRYNTSTHSATGSTPFLSTFGSEALDWDAELGLTDQVDQCEQMDLPARMRHIHNTIFHKSYAARTAAERAYNKTVHERQYQVGDRVLLYDNEGDVAIGRKLRTPWTGPYRVIEKLTPLNYVLKAEASDAVARSHVNRLARLDERVVEAEDGRHGVFPDTLRMIKSIQDWQEKDGVRKFKLRFRGRSGSKWVEEKDLPPVVVETYLRCAREREASEEGK